MSELARQRVRDCDCDVCFYCRAPLSTRHEHDHFPIPFRHGGDQVVACCLNCHDLKDRLPLHAWPIDELYRAIEELPPLGRLLLVKLISAERDATEKAA